MSNTILFLLGDCPGNYTPLMFGIAQRLKQEGNQIIVASTSKYYEHYTGVDFTTLATTYYLSDFLNINVDLDIEGVELDFWTTYPSYVRDYYYTGNHRNKWDTYKKLVVFYQNIFGSHRIDLVVSEPPSNSFLYIGYSESLKTNALFMGYLSARIPKHVNIFLDPYGEKLLENHSINTIRKTAPAGPPDYMLKNRSARFQGQLLKQFWLLIRYSHLTSIETSITPIHQVRSWLTSNIGRKLRYLRVKLADVFDTDFENNTVNILFPLHLRPEASTTVLARYYENDIELLKNIAFSLPINSRLIVKEHTSALGVRNLSFYKKILSFPNVILLSPYFDLSQNMGRFDASIVLTSTVGFEAIQSSVPVYLLGKTFYSEYEYVTRIESYADLEKEIRRIGKNNPKPNKTIMKSYLKKCFPGRFNYMSDDVISDRNLSELLVPVRQILDYREKDGKRNRES